MTLAARQLDIFGKVARSRPTAAIAVTPHRGLLRRIFDNMMFSRQRQVQCDIDRLVAWRDGSFTDSVEREIAERSYSNHSFRP